MYYLHYDDKTLDGQSVMNWTLKLCNWSFVKLGLEGISVHCGFKRIGHNIDELVNSNVPQLSVLENTFLPLLALLFPPVASDRCLLVLCLPSLLAELIWLL